MKLSAKVLSALMALAMSVLCFFQLVSCGNGTEQPGDTTPAVTLPSNDPAESTDPPVTEPVFKEANYGGADFTVFMRSATASSYPGLYILTEEPSEIMSSAVFTRNDLTEERYGIKINGRQDDNPYSFIETSIKGGAVDFDWILDRRLNLAPLANKGLLYNLNDLDIDFTNPWWDKNSAEQYEIAGKLFIVANDISIGNLAGVRFFFFNKNLVETYHLEDPYQLMKNNNWVLDEFLKMVQGVNDPGPEGTLGTYGLLRETGASNGNHMHLLTGCGIYQTQRDAEGGFVLGVTENLDKVQTITDKLRAVFDAPGNTLTYSETNKLSTVSGTYKNDYDRGRASFAEGHFLFVQNGMNIANQFAEMADDYGVLPNPKYNSDQENYAHKMDKFSLIWGMPNAPDAVDTERAATVADYWAYQSMVHVMPAYYDITIKTKRVNEVTASENLDIIKATIVYEPIELFGIQIAEMINTCYEAGTFGGWNNQSKMLTKNIGTLVDSFRD